MIAAQIIVIVLISLVVLMFVIGVVIGAIEEAQERHQLELKRRQNHIEKLERELGIGQQEIDWSACYPIIITAEMMNFVRDNNVVIGGDDALPESATS